MQLTGTINQPENPHPKRIIKGFQTKKEEPSGKRIWTLISELHPNLDDFIANSAVLNLIPIALYDGTGKNIIPEELPAAIKKQFSAICLKHFRRIVEVLQPKTILCFGRFVEKCLKGDSAVLNATIVYVQHPSPRIPNNQNWVENTRPLFESYSRRRVPTELDHGRGLPGG